MTTTEVVTIGAVALLVIKEAFSMVRASRQRNGHSRPEPASVTPDNAPWFKSQQKSILRGVNRILRHHGLEEELEQS